jgi:dCTP deaminase
MRRVILMDTRPSYLSRDAILEQLEKGGIVIEPFYEGLLNNASYNSLLGPYYWRRQLQTPRTQKGNGKPVNPYDPATPEAIFTLQEAQPARKALPDYSPDEYVNIKPDDMVIIIKAGEYILGHTLERIGGTMAPDGRCFLAEMKARSTVGRFGIEVCRCAGLGDIGYQEIWTAELQNNTDHDIALVVGTPLMQFRFFETTSLLSPNYLYGADTQRDGYQRGATLEAVKLNEWTPKRLLPRPLKVFREAMKGVGV